MGIMVYSLLWVMQDFVYQQYYPTPYNPKHLINWNNVKAKTLREPWLHHTRDPKPPDPTPETPGYPFETAHIKTLNPKP